MTNEELIKKLRDLHRDPRPASAVWLFENQLALYDAAAAIEELQAELDEVKQYDTDLLNMKETTKEEADEILEYIRNAPIGPIEPMSIEQLPKRGKWIYKPKDAIEMMFTLPKCSVCGHESSDANNYCPNCGAKMEVQDDG